jgi:hypothetical protein
MMHRCLPAPRAIFWFICISSAFGFIVTFLCAVRFRYIQTLLTRTSFLPETLRAIVGNGSIPPPRAYRTPLNLVKPLYRSSGGRPPPKPFQNPIIIFSYPDVAIVLFFNGIFNCVYYGVTATISSLFSRNYTYLSETEIGLCYLAIGGGMVVGTLITGQSSSQSVLKC